MRRSEEDRTGATTVSKEIVYRAILAEGKALGNWTVGDLRKFVLECSQQSISDDTPLRRVQSEYSFGIPMDGDHFVAERTVEL